MVKNLKLNIKNAQLAQALKKAVKPSQVKISKKEAEPIDSAKEEKSSADAVPKKRKSRLIEAPNEEQASGIAQESQPAPVEPVIESIQGDATNEAPAEETAEHVISSDSPAVDTPATAQPASRNEEIKPKKAGETPEQPAPSPLRKKEPAKDLRQAPKRKEVRSFDARDRQGLRDTENEAWRKRRIHKSWKRSAQEELVIRPKEIKVCLPITIKDLAHEMKLKSSQLISKLFMQGMTLTINDYLDDETAVQLLGHEFDCAVSIDTFEKERIQITDQTIRQEIAQTSPGLLVGRSPVITFMGHVDHGKTSLIDAIRKSNRVASEAGAITQHIGAFKVPAKGGTVTILDTPGHEAFSEMRSRGANVTDIVVLVIAGDEGMRAQTEEALRQAQEAHVPILVAINKADKPGFDAQKVYRELADKELLPEAWGGSTITVNCSAVNGEGIPELLEMIALQAEILELRANPHSRARGTVLESEMHKGLGAVATVLIQNGQLRRGDAIVFGHFFGRIKTMQDDHGKLLEEAGPSTPVKITGLSELAEAGEEFIVVKNEKEARELAEARAEGHKRSMLQQAKMSSLDRMIQKRESGEMKILPLILRADVQGSLEALKNSLLKIHSKKVRIEIVNADVGEISESDIALAAASKATIVGFHTRIESHAEPLIKQKKVDVVEHDVIYRLIDSVKALMKNLLDKLEKEVDLGEAIVKAVFKSSQIGLIAGCQVTEGLIRRNTFARQLRGKDVIWKGKIASLKRVKEDIREVAKGLECGIVLEKQNDIREGDIIQSYEITYLDQDL